MTPTDWSRATWCKSSRSNGSGDCVEVAMSGGMIGLRDSKDPAGPILICTHHEWQEFLHLVTLGTGHISRR